MINPLTIRTTSTVTVVLKYWKESELFEEIVYVKSGIGNWQNKLGTFDHTDNKGTIKYYQDDCQKNSEACWRVSYCLAKNGTILASVRMVITMDWNTWRKFALITSYHHSLDLWIGHQWKMLVNQLTLKMSTFLEISHLFYLFLY